MARILIAEDEPRISAFVEKGLSANGFAVTMVTDGPGACAGCFAEGLGRTSFVASTRRSWLTFAGLTRLPRHASGLAPARPCRTSPPPRPPLNRWPETLDRRTRG